MQETQRTKSPLLQRLETFRLTQDLTRNTYKDLSLDYAPPSPPLLLIQQKAGAYGLPIERDADGIPYSPAPMSTNALLTGLVELCQPQTPIIAGQKQQRSASQLGSTAFVAGSKVEVDGDMRPLSVSYSNLIQMTDAASQTPTRQLLTFEAQANELQNKLAGARTAQSRKEISKQLETVMRQVDRLELEIKSAEAVGEAEKVALILQLATEREASLRKQLNALRAASLTDHSTAALVQQDLDRLRAAIGRSQNEPQNIKDLQAIAIKLNETAQVLARLSGGLAYQTTPQPEAVSELVLSPPAEFPLAPQRIPQRGVAISSPSKPNYQRAVQQLIEEEKLNTAQLQRTPVKQYNQDIAVFEQAASERSDSVPQRIRRQNNGSPSDDYRQISYSRSPSSQIPLAPSHPVEGNAQKQQAPLNISKQKLPLLPKPQERPYWVMDPQGNRVYFTEEEFQALPATQQQLIKKQMVGPSGMDAEAAEASAETSDGTAIQESESGVAATRQRGQRQYPDAEQKEVDQKPVAEDPDAARLQREIKELEQTLQENQQKAKEQQERAVAEQQRKQAEKLKQEQAAKVAQLKEQLAEQERIRKAQELIRSLQEEQEKKTVSQNISVPPKPQERPYWVMDPQGNRVYFTEEEFQALPAHVQPFVAKDYNANDSCVFMRQSEPFDFQQDLDAIYDNMPELGEVPEEDRLRERMQKLRDNIRMISRSLEKTARRQQRTRQMVSAFEALQGRADPAHAEQDLQQVFLEEALANQREGKQKEIGVATGASQATAGRDANSVLLLSSGAQVAPAADSDMLQIIDCENNTMEISRGQFLRLDEQVRSRIIEECQLKAVSSIQKDLETGTAEVQTNAGRNPLEVTVNSLLASIKQESDASRRKRKVKHQLNVFSAWPAHRIALGPFVSEEDARALERYDAFGGELAGKIQNLVFQNARDELCSLYEALLADWTGAGDVPDSLESALAVPIE